MRKIWLGGFDAELNEHEKGIQGVESGIALEIPRRYDTVQPENNRRPDNFFSTMRAKEHYDWQIHYHFTGDLRSNKTPKGTYGSSGMTFRRLFVILIGLNGGVNFIDNYIENIFPYTDIGREMEDWIGDVEQSVTEMTAGMRRKKDGTPDRRTREYASLQGFISFVDSEIDARGRRLSTRIKQDIIDKMRTGVLPLSPSVNSGRTERRRKSAGLLPEPRFYATSRLIRNIRLTCRFERRKPWQSADISV